MSIQHVFRTHTVQLAYAVGAILVSVVAARPGDQPDPISPVALYALDAPPKPVADALRDLTGADAKTRRAASAALAELTDAEPYLRHYCGTKEGKADDAAGEALDALEKSRAKRNMKRVSEWAKAGRYDLLVDVSLHLTETDQADEVGQAFFDFAKHIEPIPAKLGGPEAKPFNGFSMKLFAENQMTRRFHEKTGVPKTDWIGYGFVRAQSCLASARTRFNWLVLTRDRLKGTDIPGNMWENCYIFHNSDLELDDLMTSFVVCDGDVDIVSGFLGSSVVIASGSIRKKNGIGSDSSSFFAGGDFMASERVKHQGLYLAGGSIIDAKTGKSRTGIEREKPGLKENPFGVRFFQSADVGVELATKGAVVSVAKLTPGSPLTKCGVQVGDVITQVNDKSIKTANDVRRELRYSVALEAGIFHIRRGDEKITRVVYFKNGLEK